MAFGPLGRFPKIFAIIGRFPWNGDEVGCKGRRVLLPANSFIRLPLPAAITIEAIKGWFFMASSRFNLIELGPGKLFPISEGIFIWFNLCRVELFFSSDRAVHPKSTDWHKNERFETIRWYGYRHSTCQCSSVSFSSFTHATGSSWFSFYAFWSSTWYW